ncbi:hypothetical protein [Clostridium beijerinckii]|uniref:Uncharacterized protein n=2 Tax=Clostridium beijerinckii TaxID=1520 RepID=A0A9Q5CR03_CLOBE|nr:hypothetical protein [Clostridium beijerinckii]AQS05911.1 hypothetical protein CLBIJ_33540 [Clostridium beijerinckii]MBA2887859.1 hypothetical protein [Clostridium beijerinckii]MBA2902593.1 hypothetical protein [Clostridium beijerinckii]MBA2912431.1 hypothetical protein [Clostridium beijerinckii]MBA9014487.1 hypothetical protein [Clostridium beijerinckii]
MGKKVQTKRIVEIPIDTLKDTLSYGINEKNKFEIINCITEYNGYGFIIKGKMSMRSWGEDIILTLESVNEYTTKVTIKSECRLQTQIFDWNVNQKNIDELFSMMKPCIKKESVYNENN